MVFWQTYEQQLCLYKNGAVQSIVGLVTSPSHRVGVWCQLKWFSWSDSFNFINFSIYYLMFYIFDINKSKFMHSDACFEIEHFVKESIVCPNECLHLHLKVRIAAMRCLLMIIFENIEVSNAVVECESFLWAFLSISLFHTTSLMQGSVGDRTMPELLLRLQQRGEPIETQLCAAKWWVVGDDF